MRRPVFVSLVMAGVCVMRVAAQDCTSSGADLIVSAINSVGNYNSVGEHDAFTANYVACNIGDVAAGWDTSSADHPVFAMGLYRVITDGGASRIEQVGMSWAHHAISGALNSNFCCSGCGSSAITMFLSPRCSTTSSSGFIGTQQYFGPRYQVSASTGVFDYPFVAAATQDGTSRRLRARLSDLVGAAPTTRYFIEMQLVSAADTSDGNVVNNATTREVRLSGTPTEQALNFANGSVTHAGRAAIFEWQDVTPGVVVRSVEIPGDGVVFVAGNVTDMGNGRWRYDYAIQNLNADRGIRSLSIPIEGCTAVEQVSFRDVGYHSGDGPGDVNFDDTDWAATLGGGSVTWTTASFDENPSANALRWGTLYSFSFVSDASAEPSATATLNLFRPGLTAAIEVAGLPAPLATPSPLGDLDTDCDVDLSDLARMLATFGLCTGQPGYFRPADLTDNGCVELGDLAILLANFGL
ncbi:MAG: hypothetical protein ACKVS9_16085 [Phycisphaerae bacterium]